MSKNIYLSPLCSCIKCHKVYSKKGIHSHFLINHTDKKTRIYMIGESGSRKSNSTKTKQNAIDRRSKYLKFPDHCNHCNRVLPYNKRKNKFCSHSCSASQSNRSRPPKSEETKNKHRQYGLKNKKGFLDQNYIRKPTIFRDETKWCHTQCKECNILFDHLKSAIRKYCSRNCSNKNSYHPNSTQLIRTIYHGFQMDSNAELTFAKLLDSRHIKWFKNNKIFFSYVHENVNRKYYPDFYLPDFDMWIEIKSTYYYNKNPKIEQLKWKSLKNIIVVWSHDIHIPNVF
jgi:hypothetical protein